MAIRMVWVRGHCQRCGGPTTAEVYSTRAVVGETCHFRCDTCYDLMAWDSHRPTSPYTVANVFGEQEPAREVKIDVRGTAKEEMNFAVQPPARRGW